MSVGVGECSRICVCVVVYMGEFCLSSTEQELTSKLTQETNFPHHPPNSMSDDGLKKCIYDAHAPYVM